MAKIEMTPAWWKANKAKTLLDKGDTVYEALEVWNGLAKDWARAKTHSDEDVKKLAPALTKLADACGDLQKRASTTLHRETIGYLQAYITNCVNGLENLKARKKLIDTIREDKVPFIVKDAEIRECFKDHAKKAFIYDALHTWVLFEKKKYEEATRLYSNNGVGEGDWNVPPRHNIVMYNNFVAKIREDKAAVDAAILGVQAAINEMLMSDSRHFKDFTTKNDKFLELMDTRFPLPLK